MQDFYQRYPFFSIRSTHGMSGCLRAGLSGVGGKDCQVVDRSTKNRGKTAKSCLKREKKALRINSFDGNGPNKSGDLSVCSKKI